MATLAEKECIPCKGDVPALKGNELAKFARELGGSWQVVREHHLEKEYKFKDFRQALDFTNQVGELAELQGHHPDIFLAWGKVKLTIWTHKIDGLTESDFIMAALRAGFQLTDVSEFAPDAEFATRYPRAAKYIGWPMLVVLELVAALRSHAATTARMGSFGGEFRQ